METKYKKALSLLILGSRGVGKSRLGNKLLGKKEFIEDSLTTETTKFSNKSGIEIIDTKGLSDSNEENKILISSICNEIKKNKPNILAFVHNTPNKILNESSKTLIQEICKMFDTKSVWNHFIIIFTYASCISQKNREKYASGFSDSILKVLTEYYKNNNINDNLPIPKKLKYYFVELGDDDDYKLKQDTILELGKIMKLTELLGPINNNKEKIILKITTTKCRESLKKYDRYIDDENGNIKLGASAVGTGVGTLALSSGAQLLAAGGLTALGVTAAAPIVIVTGVIGGVVYGLAFPKIIENLGEVGFYHKVD